MEVNDSPSMNAIEPFIKSKGFELKKVSLNEATNRFTYEYWNVNTNESITIEKPAYH